MSHLYIVVDCKTPGCATAHTLKYLGEKGKIPEVTDYWIPVPLLIECPTCRRTYDYSDSEEQFRQVELPTALSGYSNKLGDSPWSPPQPPVTKN